LAAIATALNDLHATARAQLGAQAVLACESWAFDTNGLISRWWHVPFRCVAVSSLSTMSVTVTSSTPGESAPTSGPGMAVIAAGKSAVCNIAGRALTLYGNPGDIVTLQVFASTQPPAWG
jgi:hypothetical protein